MLFYVVFHTNLYKRYRNVYTGILYGKSDHSRLVKDEAQLHYES